MEINKHKLISLLGIGAFGLFSMLEFSHLIKYVIEQLLIIYNSNSISSLWVPEIMATVIFTIAIVVCVKYVKSSIIINSKKWLFSFISIFFIIITLQFLSSFFGTGFLISTFPTEFDNFYELKKENLQLLANLAFIPILRYIIVVIVLIWEIRKRDDKLINGPTKNT